MRVHIVHGNKPLKDGLIDTELTYRLYALLENLKSCDVVILTGGTTRPGYRSEAAVAATALTKILRRLDRQSGQILLEERSKTTGENVRFALNLCRKNELKPSNVFVYHRRSALAKTRTLYRRLWDGEVDFTFIPGQDSASILTQVLDQTLLRLLAYLDPREEGHLWKFMKRTFRNA